MKSIIQGISLSQNDSDRLPLLKKLSKTLLKRSYNDDIKKQLYKALGDEFFTRFLEMESKDDLHKKVAVSILSAIGCHPDLFNAPAIMDNVPHFKQLLATTDSGLQDDVLDLLEILMETTEGVDALIKSRIVSTMARLVAENKQGLERVLPMTMFLILMKNKAAWQGCEEDFHTFFSHIVKEHELTNENGNITISCIALTYILRSAPESCKQRCDHPWLMGLIRGLQDVFKLRLAPKEREEALKLVSTVVDVCGTHCLLPPYTPDSRLYIVSVNLCCAELRMLLQNTDMEKILGQTTLLVSCNSFLGRVIRHMKEGVRCVPIKYQEQIRTVLGVTFTTIIQYLNSCISEDSWFKYIESVLRVVRGFTGFLADETFALRKDVYELIPFLIKLCKLHRPLSAEEKDKDHVVAGAEGGSQAVVNGEMAEDGEKSRDDSNNYFGSGTMMSTCRKLHAESNGDLPLSSLIEMQRTIDGLQTRINGTTEENIVCMLLPGFSHWSGTSQSRLIMMECGAVGVLERYLQQVWDMYHRRKDGGVKIGVEFLCNIFYKLNKARPNILTKSKRTAQPDAMTTEKKAFRSAMSLVTTIVKTERGGIFDIIRRDVA